MSTEEVTTTVGTIESEAEKLLEQAGARAAEILLKAKEEASKMLSSELPMEEIKAECEKLIRKAQEEASQKTMNAEKKAAKIKANAEKKVEEIAKRIIDTITGVV